MNTTDMMSDFIKKNLLSVLFEFFFFFFFFFFCFVLFALRWVLELSSQSVRESKRNSRAISIYRAGSCAVEKVFLMESLKGHKGEIDSVECFSDSSHLVSCSSADKTVRVWDTRSKCAVRCFTELPGNHASFAKEHVLLVLSEGSIHGLDLRMDSKIVSSASKSSLFCDVISDEVLNQAVVTADDSVFLCDDNGCVTKVSSVFSSSNRPKLVFGDRHSSLCTSIAAVSTELISVGTDCAVKQWNSSNGKLLKSHVVSTEQEAGVLYRDPANQEVCCVLLTA